MKKNRAFLKWAGGKYTLVDEIRQRLPQGECLIEPFVGAGSVFLNTDYDRYVLADINNDLINLYKTVQKKPEKFVSDAGRLFTGEFNNETSFYALRAEFNKSQNAYRRSLLFLYLNRHCYNGLCRYNLSGEFNVPFGRYKRPYFPEQELFFFSEKAQRAKFVCAHYEKVMAKPDKDAVVYCDPPYAPLTATANFTAYHASNFNLSDQQNLARLAEKVAVKRGVPVLISNHSTEQTRLWYKDAELFFINVRRTISSNKAKRLKVNELLALYR
jgi:DNA adenine methylase